MPQLNVVEAATKQPLRILLVDTDEKSLMIAQYALRDLPIASLKAAAKAETASALAAAEHFDLVVVDPVVPNSLLLLKEIKEKCRWTATLVVTSDQTPQLMRQVVKCRIDGLLFRPLTAEEFVEQVLLLARAVRASRQRQQRRVLAIGAHPDNVEIGCGGTLAWHKARGDELHILTLSRGSSDDDVVRAIEANRAAELLGANLRLANLRNAQISEGVKTIQIIEAAIKDVRPTHFYTHSVEDTHQDHRAVHAASLVAARNVPNFFSYQSPSSTVDFRPHRFVDITHFIGQKLKLIDTYHSQVGRGASIQSDVTVATARYWGRFAGYILAEPLKVIRERDSAPTRSGGTSDSAPGLPADNYEDDQCAS